MIGTLSKGADHMPNWIDEQVMKQRFAEIVRTAEQDREIRILLGARAKPVRFYNPVLAGLGRRLVAWGYHLQLRYDPIIDVQIVSQSHGKVSQC
jgi:hypothetical protein